MDRAGKSIHTRFEKHTTLKLSRNISLSVGSIKNCCLKISAFLGLSLLCTNTSHKYTSDTFLYK